jgi:hypothetical protein
VRISDSCTCGQHCGGGSYLGQLSPSRGNSVGMAHRGGVVSNGRNDHRTAAADSAVQPYISTDAEQMQKANQSRLVRSKTQTTAAQDFLAEKSTGSVLVHELYVSAHWTKNSI